MSNVITDHLQRTATFAFALVARRTYTTWRNWWPNSGRIAEHHHYPPIASSTWQCTCQMDKEFDFLRTRTLQQGWLNHHRRPSLHSSSWIRATSLPEHYCTPRSHRTSGSPKRNGKWGSASQTWDAFTLFIQGTGSASFCEFCCTTGEVQLRSRTSVL